MKTQERKNHSPSVETNDKEPLKLTRRAKLAVASFIAIGATIFGHEIAQSDDIEVSSETVTHTIQPGETTWKIASSIEGSDSVDMNVLIDHIEDTNPTVFEDDKLDIGEELVYPVEVK